MEPGPANPWLRLHVQEIARRAVRAPPGIRQGRAAPPAGRGDRGARHARHAEPDPQRRHAARLLGAGPHLRAASESRPKPYLSICAIYRDEADYLAEWVEFHRLVGVERFFLYNNFSSDHHLDVLAPYMDEGIVTVRDWQVTRRRVGSDTRVQRRIEVAPLRLALDRVHRPGRVSLLAQAGSPCPTVLSEYEEWPGVAVRWAMFGTSGHRTEPPGLVIENYLRGSARQQHQHEVRCRSHAGHSCAARTISDTHTCPRSMRTAFRSPGPEPRRTRASACG